MSFKKRQPSKVHFALANAGLKAVILAAGKDAIDAGGQPLILQMLGERSILECVVQNALQVVPPQDIYIVAGDRLDDVRSLLGSTYNYVLQEKPLGTGDAVVRVCKLLKDFPGNLLILYGDTPLFRPDIDSRTAQPASVAEGASDAAHRECRPSASLRAHHSRSAGADRRYHRGCGSLG